MLVAAGVLTLGLAACGSAVSEAGGDRVRPSRAIVRAVCSQRNFELSLVSDRGGRVTPVAAASWFAVHGGVQGIPMRGWKLMSMNTNGASLTAGNVTLHATRGVDGTWQVDSGRC